MTEIFLAPDVLRSEVLHVLDAALRHFPARGPHHLEAHRVRVELALQVDDRLRLEAMVGEPAALALGVGRAEAGETPAGIGLQRRRQDLDVALLKHHAAIGANAASRDFLDGDRGHHETQLLEQSGRGVEIADEMRNVIEKQLAGRRPLEFGGIHVTLSMKRKEIPEAYTPR